MGTVNFRSRARRPLATSLSRTSLWIQEIPSDDFQRQHLVDFAGVVTDTREMIAHESLNHTPLKIWSGESPGIEKHFSNVPGKRIAIPDAEMFELVPAEEQSLKPKRRKPMIHPSQPLGHTMVVGIF